MTHHSRPEFQLRHAVINFLSDQEVARVLQPVSPWLAEGEEFLDMEDLMRGVQRASGATRHRPLLARSALDASTWQRILATLARQD